MTALDGKRTRSARLHLLVLRCQAGDERAFRELYDRFRDRTLRYLEGLLGSRAAEDVQQEVWLTVFRKIATLANPHGFRTWLYQVTRHRAIDFLRREKRHADLLRPLEEDAFSAPASSPEEPFAAPAFPGLKKALARLSPAHRDVLLLRYWEEMSYAEIALVTGCPVGTVRSRLHHARRHLKAVLEEIP